MDNDKRIGLAIIGAGAVIAERHLPALAAIPGAAVLAVYDPDKGAAERAAEAAGARVVATLKEAVQADGVDAVTVASPNVFHRAGVEAAAAAGKHVLCEKPIATNLRDAQGIVDAAERAGITLQIGFHHRFTSEFSLARRLLEAGAIGRVYAFQAAISEPLSLVPGSGNYRMRPEFSGGLTLIDFGSHRIDQLRALLGAVAQVSALFSNVNPLHGLDDNVALLVETRGGALGTFSFQRFSQGAVTPTILQGERGVLCFSAYIVNPFHSAPVAVFSETPLPAEFHRLARRGDWWSASQAGWTALWPPVVNPYQAEYEAFFASIRDRRPPPVTARDGCQTLEIVLAAYKSFASGACVKLPLDPEEKIPIPNFRKTGL